MIATPSNRAHASGDMPREKFAAAGRAGALTSEDLLAILLKTGAPGCDVFTLAHRLIAAFGGTGHLVRAELSTLKRQIEVYNEQHPEAKILGIGEAKRMELAAAFELVRREYAERDDDERKLDVTKVENRYRIFTHQSEWLRSKSRQVINAGEGVEKREPSYIVGVHFLVRIRLREDKRVRDGQRRRCSE